MTTLEVQARADQQQGASRPHETARRRGQGRGGRAKLAPARRKEAAAAPAERPGLAATSRLSCRCNGPGRPFRASRRKSCTMARASSPGRRARVPLVSGRVRPAGRAAGAYAGRRGQPAPCAVNSSSGARSSQAWPRPAMALASPGAQGGQADAGTALDARCGGSHVERRTLVVHQHKVQAVATQGLEDFDVLATGQAINPLNAGLAQGPAPGLLPCSCEHRLFETSATRLRPRSSGEPSGNQKSAGTMDSGVCCA